MADESERRRVWSDLPRDVLHLISKKLPDHHDVIRFRAVCPSWRSSAALSDPPPQFPWILELPADSKLQEELRYYSLSTGETGVIRVKESHWGKAFGGPCCGYLLLRGEGTPEQKNRVVLFNPLTNVEISLPQLPDSNFLIRPVWTGTDPVQSRTIVCMDGRPYSLRRFVARPFSWAIYHPSMTEWIITDMYQCSGCYWDGMLFAYNRFLPTKVYDVISQKELYNIYTPLNMDEINGRRCYVVELSGVIVRVIWCVCGYGNDGRFWFHISKLKFVETNKKPCWVKVSNIGSHIMFLDRYNGFSLKPIAGFKANCIYILVHSGMPCRYDIAAGTIEKVPCPFEYGTWFVPSLL